MDSRVVQNFVFQKTVDDKGHTLITVLKITKDSTKPQKLAFAAQEIQEVSIPEIHLDLIGVMTEFDIQNILPNIPFDLLQNEYNKRSVK